MTPTKCSHMRQLRLPCPTKGCVLSISGDEIRAKVITSKGRKLGWRYDGGGCPEEYLREVLWKRATITKAAGPQVFYLWVPMVGDADVSFKSCFRNFIPVFCPKDGSLISKSKIYKTGVEFLFGCKECGTRFRPTFDHAENRVDWFLVDKSFVGSNNGFPVQEYPE